MRSSGVRLAQRAGRDAPRPAPVTVAGREPGQLIGYWTTNEAGRLVMAWKLVPLAPPAGVPQVRRLSLVA